MRLVDLRRTLPGSQRQQLAVAGSCLVTLSVFAVGFITRARPPSLPSKPKRPTHVRVPNVVGETPAAATNTLREHRLGRRYSAISVTRPCAGVPPAGHIVEQHPLAGKRVSTSDEVAIQTSCPQSVPPCQARQIAMKTRASNSDFPGSSGAHLVTISLTHIAGVPCELDSPINLELLEEDGSLAAVEGNPSTYALRRKTGLGEEVDVTWFLVGQTHPMRRYSINAQLGPWNATGQVHTPLTELWRGPPHLSIGAGGYVHDVTAGTGASSYKAALVTTRAYGGTTH